MAQSLSGSFNITENEGSAVKPSRTYDPHRFVLNGGTLSMSAMRQLQENAKQFGGYRVATLDQYGLRR